MFVGFGYIKRMFLLFKSCVSCTWNGILSYEDIVFFSKYIMSPYGFWIHNVLVWFSVDITSSHLGLRCNTKCCCTLLTVVSEAYSKHIHYFTLFTFVYSLHHISKRSGRNLDTPFFDHSALKSNCCTAGHTIVQWSFIMLLLYSIQANTE